jgi:hypothetical protein
MPRVCGILAALALAALAGCSSGQIAENLPEGVALPADAPPRPAQPYQYPAVHDIPPPRASRPLSAEEQLKMEEELTGLRQRQERTQARDNQAKKKAAQQGESTGAKASP